MSHNRICTSALGVNGRGACCATLREHPGFYVVAAWDPARRARWTSAPSAADVVALTAKRPCRARRQALPSRSLYRRAAACSRPGAPRLRSRQGGFLREPLGTDPGAARAAVERSGAASGGWAAVNFPWPRRRRRAIRLRPQICELGQIERSTSRSPRPRAAAPWQESAALAGLLPRMAVFVRRCCRIFSSS